MRVRQIIESWPLALGAAGSLISAAQTLKQTGPPTDPAKTQPQPRIDFSSIQNNPLAQQLLKAAQTAGLKGAELAQFMAQCKHESWDFSRLKELAGQRHYFNRYDPKHNPRTARILGNKQRGDGERYKGRGFIQITGRNNYEQASRALNIDLVKNPDLAARPDIAASIAIWYWTQRVRPNVKDWTDTHQVTRYINGGLKGIEDRIRNFNLFYKAPSATASRSAAK